MDELLSGTSTSDPMVKSEEVISETVKLFRSSSRRQRMFEYALNRTPIWSKPGKELIKVLSLVVEGNQPTPQPSYQIEDDCIMVVCTWLVAGRSVDLWIDDIDGDLTYSIRQDNDDADPDHGEDIVPVELEFETRQEVVDWLRQRLPELGEDVRDPLV